jgi:hypothetical protein
VKECTRMLLQVKGRLKIIHKHLVEKVEAGHFGCTEIIQKVYQLDV